MAISDFVSGAPGGAIVSLRAQPRSSRTGFVLDGDVLKLRIRSAPVDGKANKELVEALSDVFRIPKSRIRLAGGETSKQKRFFLDGLDAAAAMAALERELGS